MPDRPRVTLARLMGVIVGVALACSLGRVAGWEPAGLVLALACVVEGVAWAGRLARDRAAIWVGSAYPWLVVATVLVLGLEPTPGLHYRFAALAGRDEVADRLFRALIWGTQAVALVTAGLVLGEVYRVAGEPESSRAGGVMLVMAATLISWFAAFVVAFVLIRQRA